MKCSANISKIGLQIDIKEQEDLAVIKSKVINLLENINNVECKEKTDYKVIEVYYKDVVIGSISVGAYVDDKYSFLRKMRFNLFIQFQSVKTYENAVFVVLSKVCMFLFSINLKFKLQSLTLSLNVHVKPEIVLILTPCESLNNDYRLKDNSFVYIDNDFEERIEIKALNDSVIGFKFADQTGIDFTLKTTYCTNKGIEIFDVENIIDKYLLIYLNDEQIKAFEQNLIFDNKIIKEREFDSLKLQESTIFFDYGVVERFFDLISGSNLLEADLFDIF